MSTIHSGWIVGSAHNLPLIDQVGLERDDAADSRDESADAIDDASRERDERAEERDARAEKREREHNIIDIGCRSDRAAAKRDRGASAIDRTNALHDRVDAGTDRILSARERAEFLVDDLTGAHRRLAGLLELERETTRAHGTGVSFSLAFIDVDGLKAVNDSLGHAAGDQLLVTVVETVRSRIRPYDLVVRYGGDEFLCGLPAMSLAEAERRIALVNSDLGGHAGHVTAGLAQLGDGESLAELIRRADDDLYRRRKLESPAVD